MKRKGMVSIVRTEQWEWTAVLGRVSATGSSEATAELHLLRKIVFGNEKKPPVIKQSMMEV